MDFLLTPCSRAAIETAASDASSAAPARRSSALSVAIVGRAFCAMLLGRGMATISLFCSPRKRVMALSMRTLLCGSVAMRALLRGRNCCVPISVQL